MLYNESAEDVDLVEKIKNKTARIGIIALGYVGLPLATEFGKTGFFVTGFDVDSRKVKVLKKGKTYISYFDPEKNGHGTVVSCTRWREERNGLEIHKRYINHLFRSDDSGYSGHSSGYCRFQGIGA